MISSERRAAHHCHARGCEKKTKPEMLMCAHHCSYRKDPGLLRAEFDGLLAVGCRCLSPECVNLEHEDAGGFVFMCGETSSTPHKLEDKHLERIKNSRFVWLMLPEGYVGVSTALEIGYATAVGVPVFARRTPADQALLPYVRVVAGPDVAIALTSPK